MDPMGFMEAMGTSGIPLVAAFFIGLMMTISPCPLATNIAAIAFISKNLDEGRHTVLVGSVYSLGRMTTYVGLASLIVFFGIGAQGIALFLQQYGERLIGPALVLIGIWMLDLIPMPELGGGGRLQRWKERITGSLAQRGYPGSFLLGVFFALSFCPFSAVLFFGMLIPLAIRTGDGVVVPAVFALATALPVVIFSVLLAFSVGHLGKTMRNVEAFEYWMRQAVAVIFLAVGIYYTAIIYFN
ncbi:MAG: aromatic aminobenezylarsenical efflux permease ArsG family transporter [Methanomicrobiales archaeon]|nr:aromatic aminobenezylarsenical efflux permease ArsG family transporter [Methanomicrobiales archaeon]MDI6875765.1 aromatic aminobenezylarsenical efflux permease ArsG family transporter [Methanomicrobiales archaeon]